jgi:threonine synthase
MQYFSLNKKSPNASFKDALINGLAPDKGLYFPSQIKPLSDSFFKEMDNMDSSDICFEAINQFIGNEVPPEKLKQIVNQAISFGFPVVNVEENVAVLELYHGPTLSFKDVGARFMSLCLGHFIQEEDNNSKMRVLVATSGDTGSAVAQGFSDVDGVEVIILYPSGKVSEIQEKQLTTVGGNITAIEVYGTFDDCQQMVKQAFIDADLENCRLTSANSINVARWLPQMFYYFLTYKKIKDFSDNVVFSVPSGNYGNICAGMMAQKLGLPIKHFVAANNANDVVPRYLQNGIYSPNPAIATISNAMDVGDPSNFIRIRQLFNDNFETLKRNLSGYSYSDRKTRQAIKNLWKEREYMLDPHGAVAYLALKAFMENNKDYFGVFLETAHPVKFLNVMPENLANEIEMPASISELISRQKKTIIMDRYAQLKDHLLSRV